MSIVKNVIKSGQKGLFKFLANCSPVIASLPSSPRPRLEPHTVAHL